MSDAQELERLLRKPGDREGAERLLSKGRPAAAPSEDPEAAVNRTITAGNAVPSNLAGPDPNDPSYRAARVITEEQAAREAAEPGWIDRIRSGLRDRLGGDAMGRLGRVLGNPMGPAVGAAAELNRGIADKFANRDMPPRGPESGDGIRQPTSFSRDPAQVPPPQPPIAEAPGTGTGTRIEQSNPYTPTGAPPAQQPTDNELALMRSGAVGILPEKQAAADQAKATLRAGLGRIDNLSDQMAAGAMAEQDAYRKIALANAQDAHDRDRFLADRNQAFEQYNAKMREAADISQWKGGVGGKLAAGLGMIIGGMGGMKAAKLTADNINASIDREMSAQQKTFENRAHMSQQVRAQWEDAYKIFGDAQSARLAVQTTQLDAAKNYFLSMQGLAKTEDQKMRLAEAVDNIDMHVADLRQQQAEGWAKSYYAIQDERRKRAEAAAQRGHAEALEERRSIRDFNQRKDLKQMEIDAGKYEHRAAANAAAQRAQTEEDKSLYRLMKAREKIDPVIEKAATLRKDLRGVNGEDVPGFGITAGGVDMIPYGIGRRLLSDEGQHNRQIVESYTDIVNKAMSGTAIPDKEYLRRIKSLIGSGKASEIREGINQFDELLQSERDSMNSGFSDDVVSKYEERRAKYRDERKRQPAAK